MGSVYAKKNADCTAECRLTAVLDAQASRYRISGLITFHALTTQPHWEHSSSETHKRRGQPTPTWAEHTAWPMSTELPSQAPTRSIARCPARPASAAPAAAGGRHHWLMGNVARAGYQQQHRSRTVMWSIGQSVAHIDPNHPLSLAPTRRQR